MRFRRLSTTRGFQIGFLVLLVVCLVQTGWWILDNVYYTANVRERIGEARDAQVRGARRLLDAGVDPAEVAALFPDLHVGADAESVSVRPEALEALDEETFDRRYRYGWEGTFFLVVLAAGMVVLYRALRQEERLRQRQENFIAAVGHELRSPLASLRLSGETLALRQPTEESRARLSRRIVEDTDRLDGMVTNILQTRRLEEGRIRTRPGRLRLHDAVGHVVEEAGPLLEDRGIRMVTDVPRELNVEADSVALGSVLRNLVDNAAKAVTGREEPLIRLTARPDGRFVRVEVEDNGVGFPPGEANRLFEKFYRLGEEITRTSRGSGLGLYLVRHLVELDGGRVRASSAGPGRGAEFVVHWRAAEGEMS
jgi:signal transduction histidine kinase